jgi:SAM-dependent methyltransferase
MKMPEIEKKALSLVKGKILDIGCGAGSHSLYLTERDFDVTSIDISPNAVEACRKRGVRNVRVQDMMSVENEKFDTILLLMNGTGIFGKLENTAQYLQKLNSTLAVGGQVLIDSSDIIYMFDDDDDGGKWVPGDDYYGELTFYLTYKGQQESPFDWLYLDYNTLQNAALANGLRCEMVLEGEHYDYLARLTHLP